MLKPLKFAGKWRLWLESAFVTRLATSGPLATLGPRDQDGCIKIKKMGCIKRNNRHQEKKGRCHVIKEKEAKRRIPLCPPPPPPPTRSRSTPKTGGFGQSSHYPMWRLVPKVAKGPDVEVTWQVQIWGSKSPFPRQFLNEWFLARNVFCKKDAGNFYLPYSSVKICLPLSCELWEQIFCLYS